MEILLYDDAYGHCAAWEQVVGLSCTSSLLGTGKELKNI